MARVMAGGCQEMKEKVVVFSGAGLSTESGIPTFRSSGGLWREHKVEDLASQEGWAKDRDFVLHFYQQRMHNVSACEPNAAHKAFADLEEKYHVHHVTQNVDNLLERAGCTNVRHLHGDLFHRKCERHFSCSLLERDLNYQCDYLIEHTEPVKAGDLCEKCKRQMRPNVVWFGEAVDMSGLDELPKATDIFIVVGTSAQVHPAASLLGTFENCRELYFIDPDPAPAPRLKSYSRYEDTATNAVPRVVRDLLTLPTHERLQRHQQRITTSD